MEYKDTENIFMALRSAIDWAERLTNKTPVCRVFLHTVRVTRWAPPHLARSQELDHPYRHSRSLVLHCPPFRRALVVGFWSKEGYNEDEALLRAVTSHKEFDGSELEYWDEANAFDATRSKAESSGILRGGLRSGATSPGYAGAS